MIYLVIGEHPPMAQRTSDILVKIPDAHAPAFRSAIEEIRNEIGGRLEGMFPYDKEKALTAASISLGAFAGALNQVVTKEDPNYA